MVSLHCELIIVGGFKQVSNVLHTHTCVFRLFLMRHLLRLQAGAGNYMSSINYSCSSLTSATSLKQQLGWGYH